MADRNLLKRPKKIDCYRIPLSYYLPKELLTPEILEEKKAERGRANIMDANRFEVRITHISITDSILPIV